MTGISAGTATITYTVGGPYVTMGVTVYPLPAAITGPGSVCAGGNITLTDGMPGGTWMSGNPAVATIGSLSGVVTGNSGGSAAIYYTLSTGCAVIAGVSVTACSPCSGMPTAGFSYAIPTCSVYALQLSGYTTTLGLSFQWQKSTDATIWTDMPGATSLPYTFAPAATSFYRCTVTCTVSGLSAYSSAVNIPVTYGSHLFHSVISTPDTACTGVHLHVATCPVSTTYHVTTWYGDGTSDSHALSTTSPCTVDISHSYNEPGTYTIKQFLFDGTSLVDTLNMAFEYGYCHTIPVKFFNDANANCIFDLGDSYLNQPVTTEVDSNGIPVDTISTTSGFYYESYGPPSTVYTFRILSHPAGVFPSCPISGVFYDTIQAGIYYYPIKYCGFSCGTSGFDLSVNAAITVTGRHDQIGHAYARNNACVPTDADVTVVFSPKYIFSPAYPNPMPTSHTSNSITWHLTGLSYDMPTPISLYWASFENPLTGALSIGDTVQTHVIITPTTGDMDTSNNYFSKNDTVRSGCDPNFIEVSPAGIIASGTQLQYTIHFENTGNDTAFNIYVMDTLSNYVIPGSMNMKFASAVMNTVVYKSGGHTIAKFDFPHINLLDSSHHGKSSGMLTYTINTRSGLAGGTTILNHAGIYFDDNAVVLTDTAVNIIGTPTLKVKATDKGAQVAVFPSPTTNELTIKMDPVAYTSFSITNQVGQAFIQGNISAAQTKVDVGALPAGLYIVVLKGENGGKVMKFVKM